MREFDGEDRLFRTNDLIATDLDDETVLMSIDAGSYYGLEGSARAIWERLETPISFAELVAAMVREYRVQADVCRVDLRRFLSQMEQEGLLRVD
jgi:hypothetical protein